MHIRNIILSLATFLFVSTTFAQNIDTRQLRDFENVTSYDGVSVQLVPSNKNYVKVSGDNIDEVVTQVSDKTLKIKMTFGSNFKGGDSHVIVYFAGDLKEIKATEGSSISSNEKIKNRLLTIKSIEGADVDIKVDSKDLIIKIATGGKIELEGKSENLSVNISTGGNFDGKNLKSKYGEVKVSAGGDANVQVEEILDATVTMGGNIFYYGETKTVNKDISLGGNIEAR
ncbi:MAG: head GIN domain-containing protein [Bacteroidota bacterium]